MYLDDKELKNIFNRTLLSEVADYYDYMVVEENEKIILDNGVNDYGLKFCNVKSECGHHEYDSYEEALKDFLPLLKDCLNEYTQRSWLQKTILRIENL